MKRGHVNKANIEEMTAEELIKWIHHYLNQHSSTALGWVITLQKEVERGALTSNGEYLHIEFFSKLRKENESIRELSEAMTKWMTANNR